MSKRSDRILLLDNFRPVSLDTFLDYLDFPPPKLRKTNSRPTIGSTEQERLEHLDGEEGVGKDTSECERETVGIRWNRFKAAQRSTEPEGVLSRGRRSDSATVARTRLERACRSRESPLNLVPSEVRRVGLILVSLPPYRMTRLPPTTYSYESSTLALALLHSPRQRHKVSYRLSSRPESDFSPSVALYLSLSTFALRRRLIHLH